MNNSDFKNFTSELSGQVQSINELLIKYEIKNPEKIFAPIFVDGRLIIIVDEDVVLSALVT